MRPLLLPAVLCAALVVTACTSEPEDEPTGPRAQVGDVLVHAFPEDVEGRHAYVVVPGARYDFLVSTPREALDTSSAGEAGVAPEPADGAAVVEVTWSYTPSDGDWFAAVAEDDPGLPLALLVDGRRHEVGELDDEGLHAAWVVVPEDADEISVEVGYNGLTQVVEVVGPSVIEHPTEAPAHLYGTAPRLEAPVERVARLPRRVPLRGPEVSTRALTPVPYVTGLGWAPDGRAWVLVDVVVGPLVGGIEVGEEYVGYLADGGEVAVRLSGARPEQWVPLGSPRPRDELVGDQDESGDDTWRGQAVFAVPDGTTEAVLRVRRTYTVVPEYRALAQALGTPRDLDHDLVLRRALVFPSST